MTLSYGFEKMKNVKKLHKLYKRVSLLHDSTAPCKKVIL